MPANVNATNNSFLSWFRDNWEKESRHVRESERIIVSWDCIGWFMKKEAPIYLFVILRGFIKIAHFFAGIISFLERVS